VWSLKKSGKLNTTNKITHSFLTVGGRTYRNKENQDTFKRIL
jgi:hypothetical protein